MDSEKTLMTKWFQETDENTDSPDVAKVDDMDNSDIEAFGTDTSTVQNEYDPAEIETLNELIADEQHAMSAYFEAGKTTKNALLSRLYADIGKEEAFHSEQLLYAKSEITGEKYEPSDPEVKKEYEELLENGMDEETAMTTIADRHSLNVQSLIEDDDNGVEEIEAIEADIDNLEEQFTQTFANCEFLLAICESTAYKNHYELRKAYDEFAEAVVMEAMDNAVEKNAASIATNPIVILVRGIRGIIVFIKDLVNKISTFLKKRVIKGRRYKDWIKKNGISGLFSKGFSLYFYNDETSNVELSDAFAYMNLCMNLTGEVAKACKVAPPKVEPGKATGRSYPFKQLNNMKAISYASLDNGIDKLNGVVFSKSKIIVTADNQEMLADMFFGYTDDKIATGTVEKNSDGTRNSQMQYKSVNIYNSLMYVLEWASAMMTSTEKWMNELQKIAANKHSIYYKDPTKFRDCLNAMKQIIKGYSRLIKCLTHDTSECMKLDNELIKAVNSIDQQETDDVNNAINNPGATRKNAEIPEGAKRIVGNDDEGNPVYSIRRNNEPLH